MKSRKRFRNLSKFEWILWVLSMIIVAGSYLCGEDSSLLSLAASLVGVTALIFVAKGDVFGQILTVAFSLLYAGISWQFRYYGEMITYLGMTAPIAALSVVTWLRHPYQSGKAEVEVAQLGFRKIAGIFLATVIVTCIFYCILKYFHTANLIVSTVSIATSFLASYLMLCRSPFYAIAYAANDIVLITLWTLAAMESLSYLPMAACFLMFLCNDIYGFYNWRRMKRRQTEARSQVID
ncbi:MAG: nicotinamide riboside transporter PnuC [Clostridia bacterium]